MGLHELLGYRQAQARAARRSRPGRVDPVEAVEDALQVFRIDARPGVLDGDADACSSSASTERRTLPPSGVWKTAFSIRLPVTWAMRAASASTDGRPGAVSRVSSTPFARVRGPNDSICRAQYRLQLYELPVQPQRASLGQRQHPQVLDEVGEQRRLIGDRVYRLWVWARPVRP